MAQLESGLRRQSVCAKRENLACRETRRKRLPLLCSRMRRCTSGPRTCRARRERRRRSCWARCAMRDKRGSRGGLGSEGSRGTETSYERGRGSSGGAFSFTSFTSLISFTSLLLLLPLALSSCSRTVATEPGVVNFLIESMPTNLDPRIGTDAVSQRLDSLIFSSLVELDAQRIPRGDLAERWETPDPVTYVFHLRSGVKFHDGRPVTSADVKYTFDSILDRTVTSPKRGSLAMIQSIDAPDAATVIFHLQEPYAGFLWAIARPTVGIVPAGSGSGFFRAAHRQRAVPVRQRESGRQHCARKE